MPNPVALKGKDLNTDQETLHPITDFRSTLAEETATADLVLEINTELSTGVPHTAEERGTYNLTYRITAKAVHDDFATPQYEAKGEVRLYRNNAYAGLLQRFQAVFHNMPFDAGYGFPIALEKGDVLDVRIISSKKITLTTVKQTFHIHKT